jgi:hypothetical protein
MSITDIQVTDELVHGDDHHVIHPVLRSLFIKKINNSYTENDEKGIYLTDA